MPGNINGNHNRTRVDRGNKELRTSTEKSNTNLNHTYEYQRVNQAFEKRGSNGSRETLTGQHMERNRSGTAGQVGSLVKEKAISLANSANKRETTIAQLEDGMNKT
jgi:hypothetical protein